MGTAGTTAPWESLTIPVMPARNSWAKSGRQAARAQTQTWRCSQFDMARNLLNRMKHNRSAAGGPRSFSRRARVPHFETLYGLPRGASDWFNCTYSKYRLWNQGFVQPQVARDKTKEFTFSGLFAGLRLAWLVGTIRAARCRNAQRYRLGRVRAPFPPGKTLDKNSPRSWLFGSEKPTAELPL